MEHREEVYFQDGTLGNIEEMNKMPERSELILIMGERVEHYTMRRDGALIIVEFEGEEVPEKSITEPPVFKSESIKAPPKIKKIPHGVKPVPRKKKTEVNPEQSN